MDKVFSTRLDESIICQIDQFVKDKPISKKALIEAALKKYFEENQAASIKKDIIRESCGSWKRDEAAEDTWQKSREEFNKSYERRHRLTESQE